MIRKDYTAPEWGAQVSGKERFRQLFEVYLADETTADTSLAELAFVAEILNPSGLRVGQALVSRPALHAVLVEITTAQMITLREGRYRVEVYALRGGEREDLVHILLSVDRQAVGRVFDAVQIVKPAEGPAKLILNRGPVTLVAGSLPPRALVVNQAGQTVWDLGLAEPRRNLWVNGVRYFEGPDYTIDLPLLSWQGFTILPDFQLQLT